MAIDNDLSTSLLQVRLAIGDNTGALISDATINALLTINSDDVNKTIINSLQAIVADLAKQVDQEVGDVELDASQMYRQYSDLLNKLLRDPAYMSQFILHTLGGTSKYASGLVLSNSDSRRIGITEGFYSDTEYEEYEPHSTVLGI